MKPIRTLGIIITLILLMGLGVYLRFAYHRTPMDMSRPPITTVEINRRGEGHDTVYWINGSPYTVTTCRYAPTERMEQGWVVGKIGQAVHHIQWTDSGEVGGVLYALQDSDPGKGFYVEATGHTIHPEDTVFPALREIIPNKLTLGYYGDNPNMAKDQCVLDDGTYLHELNHILRGDPAPFHPYSEEDMQLLRDFVDDQQNLYIFTNQVPGSAYEIASDRLNWSVFADASDAERAENHRLAYIVLQVMKHGRLVLR